MDDTTSSKKHFGFILCIHSFNSAQHQNLHVLPFLHTKSQPMAETNRKQIPHFVASFQFTFQLQKKLN